jgi:hypothetical protein
MSSGDKEPRKMENATFKMSVFDYDAQWSNVLPVLGDPLVLRALNAGMTSWCDDGGMVWEPETGPWAFSCTDAWCMDAEAKFEASDQYTEWLEWCDANGYGKEVEDDEEFWDKYSELEAPFYPQPRTPDWYKCWGACHWLAAWNCAIGQLLFHDSER